MKEEEIPDYNVFMMCERLNEGALTDLHPDYHFRNCRPDELELWKGFPFDSDTVPPEYASFMNQIVDDSYAGQMDFFYRNTLFVCDRQDQPLATCSRWKAYGKFHSIHWLKTRKEHEGKGLGRAVLSAVMKCFKSEDYPIYIHTQPGSFRAIKLYSDFGFQLLRGGILGTRTNDLEKCLSILAEFIPREHFNRLKIRNTPEALIEMLRLETTIQF